MISRLTLADQTAAQLTRDLNTGRWRGELPGVNRLAAEIGVSREVLRAALGLLEKQGVLVPGGVGRARVIKSCAPGKPARQSLRVALLLHDRMEQDSCNGQSLINKLKYRIEEAGHHSGFAAKCQTDLGLVPARIIRMVEQTQADAWIVIGGSLELLQWFSAYQVPAIAVGGRLKGLPIASASRNAIPAYRSVFRHLIAIGHRRIVVLAPQERRLPFLSAVERALQEELATHGIPFDGYNVPDWEPTPAGLEAMLHELFRVTPPTLIQVTTPGMAIGVMSFLSRRGLRVPDDVSLISETMDNTLAWHRPAIAHFTADFAFIVRRVVRWVKAVADGVRDLHQAACLADFDPGGSIAPPRGQCR